MIVDAHCHAWPSWPYDVVEPPGGGGVAGLLAAMNACGVDAALVVAARLPGADDDNEWLAAHASARVDRLRVIADLDSFWLPEYHRPGAQDRLDELCDRLRPAGVTHYLDDDDDGWLDGAEADDVLSALAARDLPLSLHARPAWHGAIGRAAARHPDVRVVLHHFAHATALAQLDALAQHPNVSVKASGAYYADGAELASRTRAAVALFGADRVMWGSDHPVGTRHGVAMTDALETVREALAPDDRERVLGGTAREVFRWDAR